MALCTKTASCGILADWFKAQGRYHAYTETPQVGDVVFYDWAGSHTKRDHTGIVEKVLSDGIVAVEGNTAVGNDSNGGEVMERTRAKASITGYGRPAYTAVFTAQMAVAKALSEAGTKESPANSNNVKYNTWYYGKAVTGSAYPWCAVFVSWVLSSAGGSAFHTAPASTAPAAGAAIALTVNELKTGCTGGQVKAVQRLMDSLAIQGADGKSLAADGVFGTNTDCAVKTYQRSNGLTADGVVGPKTWAKLLGI